MRLVHFAQRGALVGGLEQLLADLLAAPEPGLEHAVVLHAPEPCAFAGRWPARAAAWSAERGADPDAVLRALGDLAGMPWFHTPPHESVVAALARAGIPFGVFCHGHEWWCGSGSRWYAHTRRACSIRGGTAPCALRWQALGCGSLRPANVVRGLARARAGRRALAAAQSVCVLSRFMGSEAERHGAAAARVHRIPAPTALAGGPVPPAASGPPTVLFAGRLTREKGVDVLLEAFAQMRPGVGLDVAGTGIAAGRIATRLAAHPARERIRLLGRLERAGIRDALARSAAAVVPSVWPEPFALAGLEALALGRPVVASAIGGMDEWAKEELGVLTVPPGDAAALAGALERACGEPEWADRARRAGARWVAEHHTPAAAARALARAAAGRAP